MHYDPIKQILGKTIGHNLFIRKLFYRLLDLLLLRTWHIKKELYKWAVMQQENMQVLDAGSGFGQYTYFLARKYKQWQILGVDVKQEQVDDCNAFFSKAKLNNTHFDLADLTQFHQTEKYNLVLSVDVMEHIEDDVTVFRNLYRSLRKGGMLLISTPSDQGGSDVHKEHGSSFIEEHVRDGYNIIEIQEKLSAAGFEKTMARYQYGKPGKLSWKLSMKYPINLLGISKFFFLILPFYYLMVFPFCLILNAADVSITHNSGTGLIVKAWK
ncbi:MAG: class I SAM-dependent methyltransferase [Bacteroidales bacterium]|nr:class I SAM-dependent methyltransferase [Bacteroidales bacterium]MDZ4203486.1 class I SAM-dependent methyltransferase [Bacteroidales bacterium]